MTLNGAYTSHEEAIKGSITPGKLADFVVLYERGSLPLREFTESDLAAARAAVGTR